MSRVMPNPRPHRRKYLAQDGDKDYNRIMAARREYEASLAPDSEPKARTKRSGPVTVRKGDRSWTEPSYETYIASSGWATRRKDYFEAHPRKCSSCGSTSKIHLHHKTYVRMGRELDEDLVALCESCHSKVHKLHRESSRSLAAVTDQFVKKGWLEQKKRKSPAQKGSKANRTEKRNARQTKSERVLPHEQNPVQRINPDVPTTDRKPSKVKVTYAEGVERIASPSRAQEPKPEPQWVVRARSSRRG